MAVIVNAFGEALQALRKVKHVERATLSDELRIDLNYLYEVEEGMRNPPPAGMIDRIAGFLDVEPQILHTAAAESLQRTALTLTGRSETALNVAVELASAWPTLSDDQLHDLSVFLGDLTSRDP